MARDGHPYERGAPAGKRIAVVGAGPAGLACTFGCSGCIAVHWAVSNPPPVRMYPAVVPRRLSTEMTILRVRLFGFRFTYVWRE